MRGSAVGAILAVAAVTLFMPGAVRRADASDPDTTPPVLTLPADMTVTVDQYAVPPQAYVWYYDVSAWDETDGSLPVTCDPAPALIVPLGTTATVTCSATDLAGNTATGSFTVTAVAPYTTPPTLTLPASVTLNASAYYNPPGAWFTWFATATDASGWTVSVTCDHVAGSVFPIGETTVTCEASDRFGNKATGSFTVTVVVPDHTPPVISGAADITRVAPDTIGMNVSYSVWATDVDTSYPAPTISCLPASGSFFAVGTTGVTCTAADVWGNTATAAFNVHVLVPLEPSMTVDQVGAVNPVTGVATISGTLTCARPVTAFVRGNVSERLGRATIQGSFNAFEIPCAPGGARWSLETSWSTGMFVPGTVPVQANAQFSDLDGSQRFVIAEQDVRLKASH